MPLAGALFFDWGAYDVVFLYWLENAVIGLFNILKMAFAQPDVKIVDEPTRSGRVVWRKKPSTEESTLSVGQWRLFGIPFFVVHYSLFMFVHLMFILSVLGGMEDLDPIGFVASSMSLSLIVALVLLFIEHGHLFYRDYWKGGGYKRTHPLLQMFMPYPRIVVMHLAILFGGFLFVAFSLPRFAAFVLVGLKVALELVRLPDMSQVLSGLQAQGAMARQIDAKATRLFRLFLFCFGLMFALLGSVLVRDAILKREDMKKPPNVVYVPGDGTDGSGGHSLQGGFGPGFQAFMGMLFAGVGTAIAAGCATKNRNVLRGVAAILALAWHVVGVGACGCYWSIAPKLDVWPFLAVAVYEWFGLIPLALAIPGAGRAARVRSAVWCAMLGGFLGAVVGAVLGGVAGGVGVLVSLAIGSGVAGTDWWMYATIGGAAVASAAFALVRLSGWEVPDDLDLEPSAEVRRWILRARPLCIYLGIACFVAAVGLLYFFDPGQIDSAAQAYLFWLLIFGGCILIAIGRLLVVASRF
jgi:hypothetical protein